MGFLVIGVVADVRRGTFDCIRLSFFFLAVDGA